MKRCLIIALASPAILFAGCDSIQRFTRVQPSVVSLESSSEPSPEPPADKDAVAAATPGATASLSDSDRPAMAASPSAGLASSSESAASSESPAPSQSASPAQPIATTASPAEVQLASATSLGAVARRTLDAVVESLPNPAAAKEERLARDIAAFDPFPFRFELPTLEGETYVSAPTDHRLIVVDIWATWCGPCRKAIPDFVATQRAYASRGVQVVGITCDSADPADAAEVGRKAAEIGQRLGVNYPLLIDDGSTTEQVPGFRGYPTTLFLTPSGQVLYKVTGMQTEAQLAAILDHLLAAN